MPRVVYGSLAYGFFASKLADRASSLSPLAPVALLTGLRLGARLQQNEEGEEISKCCLDPTE